MNKFFFAALLISAGSLTGCVAISDEAAKVQFHSQMSTALDGCTRLAPLTIKISHFSIDEDAEISVALREAAAKAGGDTVVALNQDKTLSEIIQHGIAYKCY